MKSFSAVAFLVALGFTVAPGAAIDAFADETSVTTTTTKEQVGDEDDDD